MKKFLVVVIGISLALFSLIGWQLANNGSSESKPFLQNPDVHSVRMTSEVRLRGGMLYGPAPAMSNPRLSDIEALEAAAGSAGPNKDAIAQSKTFKVQLGIFHGVDTPPVNNPSTGPVPNESTTVQNPDKGKLVYLVSGDTPVACKDIVTSGNSNSRPLLCDWAITVDANTGEVLSRRWSTDVFCMSALKETC